MDLPILLFLLIPPLYFVCTLWRGLRKPTHAPCSVLAACPVSQEHCGAFGQAHHHATSPAASSSQPSRDRQCPRTGCQRWNPNFYALSVSVNEPCKANAHWSRSSPSCSPQGRSPGKNRVLFAARFFSCWNWCRYVRGGCKGKCLQRDCYPGRTSLLPTWCSALLKIVQGLGFFFLLFFPFNLPCLVTAPVPPVVLFKRRTLLSLEVFSPESGWWTAFVSLYWGRIRFPVVNLRCNSGEIQIFFALIYSCWQKIHSWHFWSECRERSELSWAEGQYLLQQKVLSPTTRHRGQLLGQRRIQRSRDGKKLKGKISLFWSRSVKCKG